MPELFYKVERELEFFEVCEAVRAEKGRRFPVPDLVSLAIRRPASSFFLHPREYVKIIKGKSMPKSSIKRELHLEILKRYRKIQEDNPDLRIYEIAKIIDSQRAPRFYISKKRAADLYYSLLKKNPQ